MVPISTKFMSIVLKLCKTLNICKVKKSLLIHDLYSALPELNPDYIVQNDELVESQPLSSEDEKEVNREKRHRCNNLKCTTRLDHPGSRKFNIMDKR